MNIYTFLSLISTLFVFSLGLLVHFKKQRTRLTLVFFMFTIALGILNISQFQMRMATHFQEAWLWSKVYAIWPLTIALSVHFVLELNQNKRRGFLFYALLYFPGLLFSYIQFSTNLIALDPIEKYWGWSMQYNYSIWHTIAISYGILYWMLSIFIPLFYAKRFTGNLKKQALIIFIGYSFNFLITVATEVFLPYFEINIPELGNTAGVVPLSLIAFAIWRYDMFSLSKESLSGQLFASISNYLLLIDDKRVILEINQNLLNRLNYNHDEVVGKKLDFLLDKHKAYNNPLSNHIFQSGEFQNKEIVFANKAKKAVPLTFSASFINPSGQAKAGFIYVGIDEKSSMHSQVLIDENKKQIEFLAEAALDLVNLKTKEEVYEYIAQKTYHFLNKQVVIGCTEFTNNSEKNSCQIKALYGVDKKLDLLSSALGFDIKEFSASTNENYINQLVEGKLTNMSFDLPTFTNGLITEKKGEKIKEIIGLKELYIIPIRFGNHFFGAIHIATKKTTPPLNNDLIESLMSIASIVLNRQYAESELSKSEKLFKSIVENSLISIFIIDLDGKFLLAEGKSLPKLQMLPGTIVGQSVFESYPHFPKIIQNVKRALKGESFNDVISILNRMYFNVSFSPFLSEDGQLLGTIVMADEITNRIKSEKKLENLSEMQSKLFQVIGHDLKSPTANILSFADLMLSEFDSFTREEIQKFIKNIQSSANNSFHILNSLLEWSKSIQMEGSIQPEKVYLKKVSEEAIKQVLPLANKKNIEIANSVEESSFVFVDKKMIITVLRNLLSNAIKFTESGGQISITAKKTNRRMEISVSDSGIGMTQEQVDTLFDFDDKKVSIGTAGEIGSGIGLQICRDFIDKNGGEITVQSKLKEGSVFTISLPIPDDSKKALA